jgi:hypothetical protein
MSRIGRSENFAEATSPPPLPLPGVRDSGPATPLGLLDYYTSSRLLPTGHTHRFFCCIGGVVFLIFTDLTSRHVCRMTSSPPHWTSFSSCADQTSLSGLPSLPMRLRADFLIIPAVFYIVILSAGFGPRFPWERAAVIPGCEERRKMVSILHLFWWAPYYSVVDRSN